MSDEVVYDDLEYLPEGLFLFNGKPFTGLAYQNYEDGKKWCTINFVEGREHGWDRTFFRDGQLEVQTPYDHGLRHGVESEWHKNGSLKGENVFEFGVLMNTKTWSLEGEMKERYVRPPSDHLHVLIVLERKS
jgi:antitoxin component YwqK of YwqJK toxin-antitoxin module